MIEKLANHHAPALWQALKNAEVWDYMAFGPFENEAEFTRFIGDCALLKDPFYYAILKNGEALGWATLMNMREKDRVEEVGNIVFSPALQKTREATEAIYLLAKIAFDRGCRRFEWKCNDLNAPSKSAALRYGFTYEGLFRQHMIIKGKNRDTTWFSMLDSEWDSRKRAFEAWLDPQNFDDKGMQKSSLKKTII
jgi:RimJ/RimL family protein N-acetyltransferase